MTTPAYPANFTAPEHTAYSGYMEVGLLRTSLPSAQASQIKIGNAARPQLSLTFAMTNVDYVAWWDWVKEYAWTWFTMDLVNPRQPTLITSNQRVRFVSDLQYRKLGHNWMSITVAAELYQGDIDDPANQGRVFDIIDSSGPATPPVDIINAGTPAAPSDPDSISAELYYY
jgi:hypothetical protein